MAKTGNRKIRVPCHNIEMANKNRAFFLFFGKIIKEYAINAQAAECLIEWWTSSKSKIKKKLNKNTIVFPILLNSKLFNNSKYIAKIDPDQINMFNR
jgi:hypothetical protein